MKLLIILCLSFLFSGAILQAQEDESADKRKLNVNGNLRLFSQVYNSNNSNAFRTSPFSYGISGYLNLSFGDYKIPVSLVYRNHSFSLQRPFFYLGLSPKIGPVQFHLGNRNLNYSRYTLGGASFFGVGAEVNSGILRLSGMAGSFRNPYAQRDSIVYGSIEIPTFERKGYAAKIGLGRNGNFVDLIFLRITDQYNDQIEFDRNQFKPKDNSVFGVNINQRFFSIFNFKVDAAVSAITSDLSFDLINNDDPTIQSLRRVLEVNPTTNISYAVDTELQFRVKRMKSSIMYRRIFPHYISLGSTYITPDKEEYLLKLSGGFLKNKVRINSSLGWQKNNLIDHRSISSNRFIGSFIMMVRPNTNFRTSLVFTNYNISNRPTIVEDNDSLKVVRVMSQIKISPTYRFKGDMFTQSVNAIFSYRTTNNQNLLNTRDAKNQFLNFGYGLTYKPSQLRGKLNLNYNLSNNYSFVRERFGVSFTMAKPIINEQLRLSINNSYFRNLINDKIDGSTYRTAFSANYSTQSKRKLQFSLNYIIRNSIVFESIKELQIRTSYGYSF